ncbi:MAG: ABC transporter substrate-binding protein [Thermoanaerobaculia bacterium]
MTRPPPAARSVRAGAVGILTALLPALLTTSACGPSPAPRRPADNSLTVALESAPIHLDPRVATDQASSRVFELVFDGLVTKDESGAFLPGLAESWEALEDGARWRFHLRKGVHFHDGSELDAADVVWTFGTLLDGSVTSSKRGAFSFLRRVVEIDPSTVEFVLAQPYGALLPNLTSYLGIVPSGATPEAMNRAPVGTGPFRFVSRSADTVELSAFDGYYLGRPLLDRVVLREIPEATVRVLELRKGSVQLVVNALPPDVVPLFRADPHFSVPTSTGANYVYLGLNLTDPRLRDLRVRQALLDALDRELLVRTLWRGLGVVTETLLPPGNWARNDDLPLTPHDPQAARKLLDQAGFPDPDGDGPQPRLRLVYKTSTDETALLQAQILQAMWRDVGIEVEIRSYEFATFYDDIKRGNFQLFSLTWTGISDPDIYMLVLHSQRVPPAGSNRGHYANARFDDLIERGARLADPALRRPLYVEAQALVAHDLPYLSLFTKVNVAVLPADLLGYRHFPSGELYSLRQMHWRPPSGSPPA